MNRVELDGKRILVIAYGHLADTMAAVPALRSLRSAYPSASIEVLALGSAEPILGPCPYIDKLVPWRDFQHKGEGRAKVEKASVLAALAVKLRASRYDATLVFHRSSGAMRKLAGWVGSPVRAGVSSGAAGSRPEPSCAAALAGLAERSRKNHVMWTPR